NHVQQPNSFKRAARVVWSGDYNTAPISRNLIPEVSDVSPTTGASSSDVITRPSARQSATRDPEPRVRPRDRHRLAGIERPAHGRSLPSSSPPTSFNLSIALRLVRLAAQPF